jgi:hypothetical protein
MNETETVRELLGRAVDRVAVPDSPDAETVFARAARVRRRRRGWVTAMAAAVVVTGTVVGPGALSGDRDRAGSTVSERSRASGFAELLPPGAGRVREVWLNDQGTVFTFGPLGKRRVGPYDADYAISRDGGVGYVRIRVANHKPTPNIGNMCARITLPQVCTSETLPNGNVLQISGQKGESSWGRDITATLYTLQGPVLFIEDNDGFTGEGSLGPVLDSLPLTKSQLRELAIRPELLP